MLDGSCRLVNNYIQKLVKFHSGLNQLTRLPLLDGREVNLLLLSQCVKKQRLFKEDPSFWRSVANDMNFHTSHAVTGLKGLYEKWIEPYEASLEMDPLKKLDQNSYKKLKSKDMAIDSQGIRNEKVDQRIQQFKHDDRPDQNYKLSRPNGMVVDQVIQKGKANETVDKVKAETTPEDLKVKDMVVDSKNNEKNQGQKSDQKDHQQDENGKRRKSSRLQEQPSKLPKLPRKIISRQLEVIDIYLVCSLLWTEYSFASPDL